jgi:bacteriorhodopsin
MGSINTAEASKRSEASVLETKIEAASERNTGWKSLVWLNFAAMAGVIASVILVHLLFPHLPVFQYRAITIFAGVAALACCSYYLTRKLDRLFSEHVQVEKNSLSNVICFEPWLTISRTAFSQRIPRGDICWETEH